MHFCACPIGGSGPCSMSRMGAGRQTEHPKAEDPVMNNRTASKWFAAIVAALSLSMVATVSPADAKTAGDRVTMQRDSGWGP